MLTSAVGGLREIVIEGATGRLVPPGNPAGLAAAVGEMLANRDALSSMSAEGRRRYLSEYSQEAMTRRWQGAYRTLLARGGRPATGPRWPG